MNNLTYWKKTKEIFSGYKIYSNIKKKFGKKTPICISQHPAIGDAYLAGLYLSSCYNGKKFVVTAISEGSIEVYRYLKINYIVKLSQNETNQLIQFCYFCELYQKDVRVLHHQALVWHLGIAWNFHGIHKINFTDLFEAIVFPEVSRNDRIYPSKIKWDGGKDLNIIKKNTVLLFPFSNTLYSPPSDFWIELVETLKLKGYCVATYVNQNEKPVEGSIPITCGIEMLISLAEYAGMVIGIRNGLMDILARAACRKIVLYPSRGCESWIKGSIIDFWSLTGFGYSEDVEEYEWEKFMKGNLPI